MIFAFGPFRLDAETQTLFRGAEPLPIGKRAVTLLRVLVEHPGAPVTKDALIEGAWPGLAVEESNLPVQVGALRRVLGGEPGGENWIQTLPRRGYRFLGPPVTASETFARPEALSQPSSAALALQDKPSIAVLPFDNLSGDPQQDYFVDGMVEEIVTALSRIRWLFVIARNSSFTYKGRAVDVKQVGRELGVSYLVEGSVRKAGNRIRITAQLLDATGGAHLWADNFDATLEEVFELQDRVASCIAGVIEPSLQAAERGRSNQRPTNDLTAYDFYLQAIPHGHMWERAGLVRALDLLGKALDRDPHYGLALGEAAVCHCILGANGWSQNPQRNRQDSIDLAHRALRAAGDNAIVLANAAYVLGYSELDIDPAISLIDRAMELNPNYAIGWTRSGWLRLWGGHSDIAIAHFQKSLRLNPLRKPPALFGIALGHFFARRLEPAAAMLLLSAHEYPGWPPCLRFLASCHAHLGRLDEAKSAIEKLRKVTPVLVPSTEHWRMIEQRRFFLDGLSLAVGSSLASSA